MKTCLNSHRSIATNSVDRDAPFSKSNPVYLRPVISQLGLASPSALTRWILRVLALSIFSSFWVRPALGQLAVNIVENSVRSNNLLKRTVKWGQDLAALEMINKRLLSEEEKLTMASERLKEIDDRMGDPTKAANGAFSTVAVAVAASSALIDAELRRETVVSQSAVDDPLLRKNYLTNSTLRTTYEMDGDSHTRDRERYRIFDQEEKLRGAFNQSIAALQKTQLAERVFQAKQSRGMPSYKQTLSDIQARSVAIKSSRARVELARNRFELSRIELQTFIGQNDLEQRKLIDSQLEELASLKKMDLNRGDILRAKIGP